MLYLPYWRVRFFASKDRGEGQVGRIICTTSVTACALAVWPYSAVDTRRRAAHCTDSSSRYCSLEDDVKKKDYLHLLSTLELRASPAQPTAFVFDFMGCQQGIVCCTVGRSSPIS